MRHTTRALAVPTALLLAVGIAACGPNDSKDAGERTGTVTSQSSSSSTTEAAESTETSGSGLGTVGEKTSSAPATEEAEVDSDTVSAQDLEVGDCFTDMGTTTDDEGATVNTVEVVDCSAPHLYEVYKNGDIEADSFPEGSAMDDKSAEVCYDAFADYVGKSLDESSLTATALTPTSTSWTFGDRTVSCVITSTDGSNLTGSAKDAKI